MGTLGVRWMELCMLIFGGESLAADTVVRVDLEQLRFKGAGEARLRSAHTGSSLPSMLRGKSPCIQAESAGERSQCVSLMVGGDAMCRATASGWRCSQQHSHAVSARQGHQLNGAHSPQAPSRSTTFHISLYSSSLGRVVACFHFRACVLSTLVQQLWELLGCDGQSCACLSSAARV